MIYEPRIPVTPARVMSPEQLRKLDTLIGAGVKLDQGILEQGHKDDSHKISVDLIDPLAILGLGNVLTFGAKKYAPHNWRKGIVYSRVIAALLRHLLAIMRGEDTDPESGLLHIDHLGCCWMFLSHYMHNQDKYAQFDDRYKETKDPVK
jgi:hypothetical protein